MSVHVSLARRLKTLWRREDGVAAMEFVLMVQVFLAIFMSAFECGLLMTRAILLEHAVDVTMRELRFRRYVWMRYSLLMKAGGKWVDVARALAELERERGSELTTDEMSALIPVEEWTAMVLDLLARGELRFA